MRFFLLGLLWAMVMPFKGSMMNFLDSFFTLGVLPGSEDTRADAKYYEHEPSCDHLRFTAQGNLTAGDIVLIGLAEGARGTAIEQFWVGLVDVDVVAGALGSARVTEGILVRTAKLADGAAFTLRGQEVWYDPVTETVDDTQDADLYLIGYVREPTDDDGVMGFEKRRYSIIGESQEQ
jgi:hypothetical protein